MCKRVLESRVGCVMVTLYGALGCVLGREVFSDLYPAHGRVSGRIGGEAEDWSYAEWYTDRQDMAAFVFDYI